MPSLEMNGPFIFNEEYINKELICLKKGNFALGELKENNTFVVKLVGKSENQSLFDTLTDLLKQNKDKKYSHFKFVFVDSLKDQYLKECKNFHDFGGCDRLDNKEHPACPKGYFIECPHCLKI